MKKVRKTLLCLVLPLRYCGRTTRFDEKHACRARTHKQIWHQRILMLRCVENAYFIKEQEEGLPTKAFRKSF